jgi:hypothetical protein
VFASPKMSISIDMIGNKSKLGKAPSKSSCAKTKIIKCFCFSKFFIVDFTDPFTILHLPSVGHKY